MNSVAVSAITTTSVSTVRKPGFSIPISATSPTSTKRGAIARKRVAMEIHFLTTAFGGI
jgi:hypothetical protein